ncbi:MAG: nicotinamide-nucleotide adenylyltransferase [Candidatus Hadarchaeales archaeon]
MGGALVKRGIFIGRFQPVHLGHVEAFKYILGEMDELIIGIGSSQEENTFENPLTASEREEMLKAALNEAGIDLSRVKIVGIPDVHDDERWVPHVESLVPKFSVVYSGNPWVQRLFKERGYEVRTQPLFRRRDYQGMTIRRRMAEGAKWESLVPESVVRILKRIGAEERLKKLSRARVLTRS